jgi:hypothetical protein
VICCDVIFTGLRAAAEELIKDLSDVSLHFVCSFKWFCHSWYNDGLR